VISWCEEGMAAQDANIGRRLVTPCQARQSLRLAGLKLSSTYHGGNIYLNSQLSKDRHQVQYYLVEMPQGTHGSSLGGGKTYRRTGPPLLRSNCNCVLNSSKRAFCAPLYCSPGWMSLGDAMTITLSTQ
jgi:hypothetical protein